jgi:hypothetical protein
MGTQSFRTTGADVTSYTSGDPLANLSLPSTGLYIMFGSLTVQNNGPDAVGGGGCGFFNGARQLSAGSSFEAAAGATATFSVSGLDAIRDSSQPLTLLCQYTTGTGPVAVTDISIRAIRLEE